jgi:hypothetical protein
MMCTTAIHLSKKNDDVTNDHASKRFDFESLRFQNISLLSKQIAT